MSLKAYLFSLAAGILVGAIYALLNVRSPAPPVVALVGLLGILVGEQLPPLVKYLWQKEPIGVSWFSGQVKPHCFGNLPCAEPASKRTVDASPNMPDPKG